MYRAPRLACQVNDSLGGTRLCARHSPGEVAAGALHLASLLLGVARQMPYRYDFPVVAGLNERDESSWTSSSSGL